MSKHQQQLRPAEYTLPDSIESERLVIGACLADDEAFPHVLGLLAADDFSLEKHSRIFQRMSELHERGDAVNRQTVVNELHKLGQLQSVDGLSYLISLDSDLPKLVNLESYCKIVREKSILRRTILSSQELISRCLAGDGEMTDLLVEAERVIEILSSTGRQSIEALDPLEIQEREGGFEAFLSPNVHPGIHIPFDVIDRTLSGFRKAKLITIAARPAVGKSALMWQCAEAAAESGRRSLLILLEMKDRDLLHRAVTGRARVSAYKFRHGELDAEESYRVQASWSDLVELRKNLLFCDKTDITVQGIAALMRSLTARNKKPDILFLDYLQILSSASKFENRNVEVSHQIRQLHMIAKQFDIPVVVLSQLSRDMEKMAREPQLSDLRDSGSVESESHQVLFLWAKDEVLQESNPFRTVKWKIAKNRDGMLNRGELTFERKYARFITGAGLTGEEEAA